MSGPAPAGVAARLLGVILMGLGALNSMLAWRGGIAGEDLHFIVLLAGAAVYAAGARSGCRSPESGIPPA